MILTCKVLRDLSSRPKKLIGDVQTSMAVNCEGKEMRVQG